MNNEATAKIAMIQGSMRCFIFGLVGLLLPFIGLPFAILALRNGGRVRTREKLYWNAAKPYRIGGVACAGFGLIIWGILTIVYLVCYCLPAIKYAYYGSD